MRNFRQLEVWKKAHELTLDLYRISTNFPSEERFGITSQLRRAAASIGANLAEGCGRDTDSDFKRFVHIARGSAFEVEYHILLAKDLEMISAANNESLNAKINEVKRMLFGLARFLENSNEKRITTPK